MLNSVFRWISLRLKISYTSFFLRPKQHLVINGVREHRRGWISCHLAPALTPAYLAQTQTVYNLTLRDLNLKGAFIKHFQ